jgi:hypothetical protein
LNTGSRIALLAAVIVIAVVGFVVLKPDDEKKETTSSAPQAPAQKPAPPPPVQVNVKNGKPVGGIKEIDASKGERVRFVVNSDVSDEIHVHGYDLMKDVKAGGKAGFSFPAKIDGEFEIELENRGEQIAKLVVQP